VAKYEVTAAEYSQAVHWALGRPNNGDLPRTKVYCSQVSLLWPTIIIFDDHVVVRVERTRMGEQWTGPLHRLDLPLKVIWGRKDPIATYACTSSKHMAPLELFSKRHFSARTFSSLAC